MILCPIIRNIKRHLNKAIAHCKTNEIVYFWYLNINGPQYDGRYQERTIQDRYIGERLHYQTQVEDASLSATA